MLFKKKEIVIWTRSKPPKISKYTSIIFSNILYIVIQLSDHLYGKVQLLPERRLKIFTANADFHDLSYDASYTHFLCT
jgi:hypothetical protein